MERTFIVSGYMRSGTSMMMNALTAGGLDPAYNKSRNEMNTDYGDDDYKPNANGFYELSQKDFQAPDFPAAYEGKLIKVLFGGVAKIKAGDYHIVFMMRNFEEIRQSYNAFFNANTNITEERYNVLMETAIGILEQRRDVNVTVLNYRDVVQEPYVHFDLLKRKGWDIDVKKAASVVDPELFRFKLEDLEVGI